MNLAERKRKLGKTCYLCGLELSGLGGILFCGVFLVLFILMMLLTTPRSFHSHLISVDYMEAPHATRMPKALREDAIVVAVMRDDTLYLRDERLKSTTQIPSRITEMVRSGSERKVYIKADKRTRYGAVVEVIDAVHDSGLEEVVFLTQVDQ
jgi:biopolymer transport protein ExbD